MAASEEKPMRGYVGIHIGAGKYSKTKSQYYTLLLETACKKAVFVLKQGGSAMKAATLATSILEDSRITNSGSGSNLTWDGTVECDAGIMDGKTGRFGAVGALPLVRNPICIAQHLCSGQSTVDHGLLRPVMLVGPGALAYAKECGQSLIYESEGDMITPSARKQHKKTMARITEAVEKDRREGFVTKRFLKKHDTPVILASLRRDESKKDESGSKMEPVGEEDPLPEGVHISYERPAMLAAAKRTAKSNQGEDTMATKRSRVSDASSSIEEDTVISSSEGEVKTSSYSLVDISSSNSSSKRDQGSSTNVNNTATSKDLRREPASLLSLNPVTTSRESPNSVPGSYPTTSCNGSPDEDEIDGETDEDVEEDEALLDTVGVVCVDLKGNLVSTCSSGGILLKRPGRVGQACIRGSGCWAQNPTLGICSTSGARTHSTPAPKYGVAVSTSGCGEFIIRTGLAQEIGRLFRQKDLSTDEEEMESINSVILERCIREEYIDSPFLADVKTPKLLGMILLLTSPEDGTPEEFLWAHSSPSFGVGYMSTSETKAHTRVSHLPENSAPGNSVVVESARC